MKVNDELLMEQRYTELCEKLAVHKLPRWDSFPDIELYMDQVVAVMEKALCLYNRCDSDENRIITPSIINNYVKLKVIPAPNKKRYSREHLAYLVMICILKQTLAISSVVKIIELQLETKSIDVLYDEFCYIYEDIISFVSMSDPENSAQEVRVTEEDESPDDMSAFILKSAIISTAGKFITEGLLSVIESDDAEKAKNDEEKKDKK